MTVQAAQEGIPGQLTSSRKHITAGLLAWHCRELGTGQGEGRSVLPRAPATSASLKPGVFPQWAAAAAIIRFDSK